MSDDLSLKELFAEADRIGDKYLSPQEIEERDALRAQMIDWALNDAEQTSSIASCALANLEANEKRLTALADEALAKYPLL